MAITYEKIATNTLGSSAASVTFSSIAATYTDLVLISNYGQTTSDYFVYQLNGDTATNYSRLNLTGDGTTAASNKSATLSAGYLNWYSYPTANTLYGANVANFMNYSNATTYKTSLARNAADRGTEAIVSLWRSTAAINSIKVFPLTGNFITGSTFTLYGIKAA